MVKYLKAPGRDGKNRRRLICAFSNPINRYWNGTNFDEERFKKVYSLFWPRLKGFESSIEVHGASESLKAEIEKQKCRQSAGWCDKQIFKNDSIERIAMSLTFKVPWETRPTRCSMPYHTRKYGVREIDSIVVKGPLKSGRSKDLQCTAYELPIKTEPKKGKEESPGKLSLYCLVPDKRVDLRNSKLCVNHLINVEKKFDMKEGDFEIHLPERALSCSNNFTLGRRVKTKAKFLTLPDSTASARMKFSRQRAPRAVLLNRPFIFFLLYKRKSESESVILFSGWNGTLEILPQKVKEAKSPSKLWVKNKSLFPTTCEHQAGCYPSQRTFEVPSTFASLSTSLSPNSTLNPDAACFSPRTFSQSTIYSKSQPANIHPRLHQSTLGGRVDCPALSTALSTSPPSTLSPWSSSSSGNYKSDLSIHKSRVGSTNPSIPTSIADRLSESIYASSLKSSNSKIHLQTRSANHRSSQSDIPSQSDILSHLQPWTSTLIQTEQPSPLTSWAKLETPSAEQSRQQDQDRTNLSGFVYPIRLLKSKL